MSCRTSNRQYESSDDESSNSDKEVEEEKEDYNISELSTSVILPSILGHSIGLHNIQRGGEEKEEEEEEESIGNESDCDNDVDEEVDIHTQ